MCGIAGLNISDQDFGKISSQKLARALVSAIEVRGTDATGGAWTQKTDGQVEVWYAKEAVKARVWQHKIKQYIPKYSRNVILHTRMATQGSPSVNENNHPIVVPGIVGVHNGHISNDDQLIRDLGVKRIAQVDSEAAFHLIGQYLNDPQSELGELRGRAALAWIRTDRPRELHLARVEGSPLAVGQTPGGSVVFASTMDLLRKACAQAKVKLDWEHNMSEYQYFVFRNGVLQQTEVIDRKRKPSYFSNWKPSGPSTTGSRSDLYKLF